MSGAAAERVQTTAATPDEGGRGRRRWYRVRVQTDEGPYVGSLRLDCSRPSLRALRDLIEEDRAYLALWDVKRESASVIEDYLAIHKGVVRFVVLLGPCAAPAVNAES